MGKVKIDHFFEMLGWEGETLALNQISSQVYANQHPGVAQVDKKWRTLSELSWVRAYSA